MFTGLISSLFMYSFSNDSLIFLHVHLWRSVHVILSFKCDFLTRIVFKVIIWAQMCTAWWNAPLCVFHTWHIIHLKASTNGKKVKCLRELELSEGKNKTKQRKHKVMCSEWTGTFMLLPSVSVITGQINTKIFGINVIV